MPNWCETTIAVSSNKEEEVKKFYKILDELSHNPSRLENGFGNMWLGNLLDYHGISWETVNCRGWVHDYEEPLCSSSGEWYMYIRTDNAWLPMLDVWKTIFALPQYENLQYVYFAEEPGCELYETSDVYGEYFPERYYVDICYTDKLGDEHFVHEYYETEEYLLQHLNRIITDPTIDFPIYVPNRLNNFEEAKEFFYKACHANDDWCANIQQIEVVD